MKCPKINVMWALRDLLKTCSTKGIQLKYKMILSVKTIGRCGAACLLELKSCVVLMRKLALFVGNSRMRCMLWKFLAFNPPVNFLYFLWKWLNLFGIFSTCEKLRAFERNQNLETAVWCLGDEKFNFKESVDIFSGNFSVANMAENRTHCELQTMI